MTRRIRRGRSISSWRRREREPSPCRKGAWASSSPASNPSSRLIFRHSASTSSRSPTRRYKSFVDSGAYRNPALWRYEFRDGERSLSFDEAMASFRDQTGRPAPATWEVGSFTAGTADHPVSGVSWFEAAAYCESVGKALPTVFHWSAAARPAWASTALLPTANVGERGLLPVGSVPAGLHGTRDMAGNVKEWTLNEAGWSALHPGRRLERAELLCSTNPMRKRR